jgi:seryl-tRNA(Sec) selenium transferase
MKSNEDIRRRLGLRPVINVSGTMTSLGASIVVPEAVQAVSEILPQFVEINDLQRKASARIAKSCSTEAGFVTASASAGISLAVAGAMTGTDLLAIERLPDTPGMAKIEVLLQVGHMVSYGAPVDQAVRHRHPGVGLSAGRRDHRTHGGGALCRLPSRRAVRPDPARGVRRDLPCQGRACHRRRRVGI